MGSYFQELDSIEDLLGKSNVKIKNPDPKTEAEVNKLKKKISLNVVHIDGS